MCSAFYDFIFYDNYFEGSGAAKVEAGSSRGWYPLGVGGGMGTSYPLL